MFRASILCVYTALVTHDFDSVVGAIKAGASVTASRQLLEVASPVLRFGATSAEVRDERRLQRRLAGGLAVLFVIVGVIHFINPVVGLTVWGAIGPVIAALVVGLLLWPTAARVEVELNTERKNVCLGEGQAWQPAAQFTLTVQAGGTAGFSKGNPADWAVVINAGGQASRLLCVTASNDEAKKVVAALNGLMDFASAGAGS